MGFHFAPAPAALSHAASAFWGFDEVHTAGASDERIVPDGCAEIVVHFGDPFRERAVDGYRQQPRVLFAGQITGPLWLAAPGRADVFAVRLQPDGARHLGLPPQGTLTGTRFAFEDVLPARSRSAWHETLDRLGHAKDFAARVTVMTAFFARVAVAPSADATRFCMAAIAAHPADCDLAQVARDAGLSSRQMQRRFIADVGLTPKLFARIARFQSAFERWGEDARGWARIAADCGYYDQAHLLRDFRQFAGEPPAAFLAALTPLGGELVSHSSNRRPVASR